MASKILIFSQMRLLVIEDEPRLRHNLAKALREDGYAVDTSETGDEGFYKASSCDYDAIVLDVMLPKMDGWEILKKLRTTKTTPVLMLTARDATTERHHLQCSERVGSCSNVQPKRKRLRRGFRHRMRNSGEGFASYFQTVFPE